MIRDFEKYKSSVALHQKWQLAHFETKQAKLIESSNRYKRLGDMEKSNTLKLEADKMKFQFDRNTASIQYGYCVKIKNDVSFLPNHCQPENRDCFQHRKEL